MFKFLNIKIVLIDSKYDKNHWCYEISTKNIHNKDWITIKSKIYYDEYEFKQEVENLIESCKYKLED